MIKRGNKRFRNIFLLGSSSLFNDAGSEMITPILPFYITSLGGTGVAIGLISGLREGLASLLKVFGGWFSDKAGKRMPFIFFGYLASVIFRILLATANLWQFIIAFVSFERIGKLRDAPRDALIAESTNKRGKGFGFHQMMDTAGAIIGTLLIILLFWKLQLEFKTIIFIAAGISALSLIPLFFVKENKFKKTKESLFKGISNLDSRLKYFIFVASVFSLANFGLYMFLLLRVREITGNIITPLIFYAIFNLVYAVFVTGFGKLSDRIGRKKVLLIGYILFFLVALSFVFLDSLMGVGILFVFYGLVYAITQSNQKAFVSDFAGNMKGTAMGFYAFTVGVVNIIGGLIAGILWDISYATMFAYISIVALVSAILLLSVREKIRK